jgi:hypothetical protein
MGLSIRTLKENLPNPHVDPTNWLMWHANMSVVKLWLIWIIPTKHSTFGNWFCLNLTKTIDLICHTTCLTTLFSFW